MYYKLYSILVQYIYSLPIYSTLTKHTLPQLAIPGYAWHWGIACAKLVSKRTFCKESAQFFALPLPPLHYTATPKLLKRLCLKLATEVEAVFRGINWIAMRRGVKILSSKNPRAVSTLTCFCGAPEIERERDRESERERGQGRAVKQCSNFQHCLSVLLCPASPSLLWHLPLTIARNLSFASASFALLFYCQFVALPLFVVVFVADTERKMAMPRRQNMTSF